MEETENGNNVPKRTPTPRRMATNKNFTVATASIVAIGGLDVISLELASFKKI